MQAFLRAFTDELVKVAEDPYREVLKDARKEVRKEDRDDRMSFRRGGAPVRRDYLASTLISAASMPLLAIAGKAVSRKMHNLDVLKAMKANPRRAAELEKELHRGPLVGRGRPDLPSNQRPSLTHGELLADAGKGALLGSAMQAIRDRFSGAAISEKKKS